MRVTRQQFQFMTQCMTSDLIRLVMEREHRSMQEAFGVVYTSETYRQLLNPATQLYYQSPGYVYAQLQAEHAPTPTC